MCERTLDSGFYSLGVLRLDVELLSVAGFLGEIEPATALAYSP